MKTTSEKRGRFIFEIFQSNISHYLFSRKVVGWSMDNKMKTSMFIKALDMAKENRSPNSLVIFYSDQGVQYASDAFCQRLKKYNMTQSMSRPGKKQEVVFLNILKYFIIAKGGILILDLKVPRFLRTDIW